MVFVKIIIFLLLPLTVGAKTYCYSDGQISELFYENSLEKIEVVDFKYVPPSYIDPVYACSGFINMTGNKLKYSSISLLVGAEKWKMGRLVGKVKDKFYAKCIDRPSCQIRWPYILSSPELIPSWMAKKFKEKSDCYVPLENNQGVKTVSFSDVSFLNPSHTSWWKMPESDIVAKTLKLATEKNYKKIIISGMTASFTSLEELKTIAAKKGIKVEVYVDHQLTSLKSGLVSAAEKLSPEIQFNLIPRTPARPFSFHFKGVLFLESIKSDPDTLIWISPNWYRVQDHTVLHDIGFISDDQDLVQNIYSELDQYKRNLCEKELKWSKCLVHERLNTKSARTKELSLIHDSCSLMNNSNHSFKRSMISFRETETLTQLKSWMSLARSKLEIHSHVFKDGDFLDYLKSMREKGVQIKLRVGLGISDALKKMITEAGIELVVEKRPNVETHAKFIIRDGQEAFITSANFTDTGLSNPTEQGFLTRDHTAIALMKSFLE